MAGKKFDVELNTSIRDLLQLLENDGDTVRLAVDGEPVVLSLHRERGTEHLSFEVKMNLWRSALGGWANQTDLDAFERELYDARDNEPIKPLVDFD